MTLTLLLLIIPVLGSIIGLIGKSWDDTKTSKIKLTPRGWTSLSVIVTGLAFTAYKSIQTQNENDKLKEQTDKVRSLAYDKIYNDCIAAIEPLSTIYYENSGKYLNKKVDDEYKFCLEMASDSAKEIFSNCNLLDGVKQGTAFDEWDKSYANYIHGYYNTKIPYSLEQTVTRWAAYIDMEDLILIDAIINDTYWTTLQNACDPELRSKDLREFNFYDNDESRFYEQKIFLKHICTLLNKAKRTSHNIGVAKSGTGH